MLKGNYKINSAILLRLSLLILTGFTLLSLDPVYAAYGQATGAGGFANDMMGPVGLFSNFVHAACIILGTSFLFASVVKYFEHRRSPLMVPISTVVFLVIAGAMLLGIPLFSYFFTTTYHLGL